MPLQRALTVAVLAILLAAPGCAKTVRLPDDPQVVVMALGYTNGELDSRLHWHVQIHADGAVQVRDLRTGKTIQNKMPLQELKTLLQYAVHDGRFFSCAADAIQKQQAAIEQQEGEPRVLVADASTTYLLIRANDQRHQVEIYALDVMAREYPEIEALTRLLQIEDCLRTVAQQVIERAKPI